MSIAIDVLRADERTQEDFLSELLARNGARLYKTAARYVSPGTQLFNDLLNGDLQQAFRLGAYHALLKFRDSDDGRGKNDVAGYCSWIGLKACIDRIRQALQELKERAPEFAVGRFHESDSDDSGAICYRYRVGALPGLCVADETDDLAFQEMLEQFFAKLAPKDRVVAELLHSGYGPQQRNNPPGESRGKRRNYVDELKAVTGYSESKLVASIGRLREVAAIHWRTRYSDCHAPKGKGSFPLAAKQGKC